MLLEFPVFAMNEDYLRALANIIFMKLESVQNLLDKKNAEVQAAVAERDRMDRERSLQLLKRKIKETSPTRGAVSEKKPPRRANS